MVRVDMKLAVAAMLPVLTRGTGGAVCSPIPPVKGSFCSGVTWNASLPLAAAELDAAAKSDFENAIGKLRVLGGPAALPLCLESWKALQCASKFQKCGREGPPQKVCRSLCMQFAEACNGSYAVVSRCADDLLSDEPPCTDYAELSRGFPPTRLFAAPHSAYSSQAPLSSSPVGLFRTVTGLPLLLTLVVVLLHTMCWCVAIEHAPRAILPVSPL